MSNNGALVISLDFELLWGVFDVVDQATKREYFNNTRKVIPQVLELFNKNGIHCTWATVGMLFNEDWEEWKKNIPSKIPNYSKNKLSAYNFGQQIASADTEELCFAPELIKLVMQTPGQELGTHTYSHYYCLEEGQNEEVFKQDLKMSKEKAERFGIAIKSLVFPRNQLKETYLKICFEYGIENVRSNPDSWYWKDVTSENLLSKIGRTGDAYLNFGKKSYGIRDLERKQDLPLKQKASRFLRPMENWLLRKLKLRRIFTEMELAARKKEIYHLWWHPHNFGEHPEESLEDLKHIIAHYVGLREKYGFTSLNMAEVGVLVS